MISSPDGWIIPVSLTPPSLGNNTADTERLAGVLKTILKTDCVDVDLELVRCLPQRLRANHFEVCSVVFRHGCGYELIDVLPGANPPKTLGLAVDLGTTRIVSRLIDLQAGTVLIESGIDNPQITIGPDVLTRIHFCDGEGGLNELHRLVIGGINGQIRSMCAARGVAPESIYLMAVASNTAMSHLFMGVPPQWMIREPYIPAVNSPGSLKAADLKLDVHPRGRIFVFPNIGSYFGGDLIAGILFTGLHLRKDPAILVDVGTNAEVVLGGSEWLIACAGAAGPALEGGVTRMGMMAGPGAIDRAAIDPETLEFHLHTIDDAPPLGICGSGVIDLAAHLFLSGMIDIRGKLTNRVDPERIREIDGIRHLIVVPGKESATGEDLTISQADLDSLVRSKAAMYTILRTLTGIVGIDFEELGEFLVAGTFGSLIDPKSAITIGMLPDLPLERYKPVGNTSLEGASMILKTRACMDEIETVRSRITYLELNVNQEFMNRFSAAKFLPHTDPSRFPSVKVHKNHGEGTG